jgi:Putative Actinobacterial Holin-X, holin superfamily III
LGTVCGMNKVRGPDRPREPSTGELVSQLSEQVSRLVRDELRLALAELKYKASELESAFVQNLRGAHYEIGCDFDRRHHLPAAFTELAHAI